MVGSFDQFVDARNCDGANCGHDQLFTSKIHVARSGYLAACLTIFLAGFVTADPIRIATYTTDLSRKGPGLLLRDIEGGKDPQIAAVQAVIDAGDADIISLQSIDWDLENLALTALNEGLTNPYPFLFSRRPNTGIDSGLDLDRDGRTRGPGDALGYGEFSGRKGMAVLSRFPIDQTRVIDLSQILWRDLPEAALPTWPNGDPYYDEKALSVLPVSTTGHWLVPIEAFPNRFLNLLTLHSTPPVFDGIEDRNGRRNADEVRLWGHFLSGKLGMQPNDDPYVMAGNLNLDPNDGDGHRRAFYQLLADGSLQDPAPSSLGGAEAAAQGPPNQGQVGKPDLETADWEEGEGPGNLRVDYVLPSSEITVLGSGILWPASDRDFANIVTTASRHRLVWVDIDF